jgi:energy-coupling factor transporter transmembrane protein EcfT
MIFIYKPGNSFFHRMDAVTKFLWLFSMTSIVLLATNLIDNLLIFIYLLLTAFILARQNILRFTLRLLPVSIVGIWLIVIFSVL